MLDNSRPFYRLGRAERTVVDRRSSIESTRPCRCRSFAVFAGGKPEDLTTLSAEVARVVVMPSVGDPLDRQVGVEQVLTYRSEPLRADHRLHGVAGEREGPVNGTGRDTVIGRQVFEAYGSLPVQARPTAPHRQLWGSVRAASRLSPPGMVVPPRAEIIAKSACRSGVPLLAGPGARGRPERATTHRGLLRKRSRLYRPGHSPPPKRTRRAERLGASAECAAHTTADRRARPDRGDALDGRGCSQGRRTAHQVWKLLTCCTIRHLHDFRITSTHVACRIDDGLTSGPATSRPALTAVRRIVEVPRIARHLLRSSRSRWCLLWRRGRWRSGRRRLFG